LIGNWRAAKFRSTELIRWNKAMLKDILEVHPLENYQLRLRFEDGVEGVIDVAQLVQFSGVFAPLRNRQEFVAVHVNPELGTICWPSGADLDPDVLYSLVTGEPLPTSDEAVKLK
jgi:hypothetical protein